MISKYKVTQKTINEVFDEVFKNAKPKQREFKGWRGCINRGTIDLMELSCGDPNCSPCVSWTNAISNALKKEVYGK